MDHKDSPNPPLRIGAPSPGSTLGELMRFHAQNNTLTSFLIDIGHWYGREAPLDRDNEHRKRSRGGRER